MIISKQPSLVGEKILSVGPEGRPNNNFSPMDGYKSPFFVKNWERAPQLWPSFHPLRGVAAVAVAVATSYCGC